MSTTSSTATPAKTPKKPSTKTTHDSSENTNPNHPIPSTTPPQKPAKTPLPKSISKPKKPIVPPPPPPQQQRKFIVAKKKSKKSNETNPRNPEEKEIDPTKAREAAYEALRASHEEFFKKDLDVSRNGEKGDVEKARSMVMEEALSCVPEPGSGRVKHLVWAFETMLQVSGGERGKSGERSGRVMNWGLPGLREPVMMKGLESENGDADADESCSVFSFEGFERDPRFRSSLDSNNGDRLSLGSRTSKGSRRSRRNVNI